MPADADSVVKSPVLPEIGVFVIAPPEICALAVTNDPVVVALVTSSDVNVPSDVTFGCAAVCSVPVIPPVADNVVNAPVLGAALPIGVLLMLVADNKPAFNVVNAPVEGVTLPIGVLSTKPPVICASAVVSVLALTTMLLIDPAVVGLTVTVPVAGDKVTPLLAVTVPLNTVAALAVTAPSSATVLLAVTVPLNTAAPFEVTVPAVFKSATFAVPLTCKLLVTVSVAVSVVNVPVEAIALPIGVLLMLEAVKLSAVKDVNEPVSPEIGVFVMVPPVIVTLPDAKFVTVPLVAAKLANPVTLPPVTVTLPDAKFVTEPVVAANVVKPVMSPPVT